MPNLADISAPDVSEVHVRGVFSSTAPAELDHRRCVRQWSLSEVITGESVSLPAPAGNHWFLAKVAM
jgi:hypothetical protein